ncbi:hypothetical protein [Neorhizobium galegae]|jgi:hypothetical protein|uniref:Uncharacterized protein n=2 Tax=Neorhizobium galegae TaxID=399 RepID=A0A068SV64_NEOGA|nr:hypothetical protein [Neorhizobium galegae]KAB1088290.1 hypothetical protein F4V91_18800 [Neorhizobium galegae]MCQ1853743.1 hypothetical protein [Neorhizobium galegae]CDN49646.1 Hypothetical protein RG540_CH34820 [Neorhizobium galegae bv. orientalis str. HAMBI 540]CDZ46719.1 Hypothetical protein NGAL_HAMBI2427_18260 [Neorhizobium galegae bv. orientalis]
MQATRTAARTAAPSRATSTRLQDILLLIGQLNYTWTNTESLLIHMIAGLAKVDKETAIVIFLTLNTTRARIDLVDRLTKMRKTAPVCRKEILEATRRLSEEAKLRNKYNHCIYSFDPDSGRNVTQSMRIFESRDEIKYGKIEELDAREIGRIQESINSLVAINRMFWGITERYGFPT